MWCEQPDELNWNSMKIPTVIQNPIEKPIITIREEFTKIDNQLTTARTTILEQVALIEQLTHENATYKRMYEEVQAKLDRIKDQL